MLDTEVKQTVYCNSCRYLYKGRFVSIVLCTHPDNCTTIAESWARPPQKINDRSPANINKDNDCEWYCGKDNQQVPTNP